jgi:hypothetical protein
MLWSEDPRQGLVKKQQKETRESQLLTREEESIVFMFSVGNPLCIAVGFQIAVVWLTVVSRGTISVPVWNNSLELPVSDPMKHTSSGG